MHRRHVVTTQQGASSVLEVRVGTHQDDCAKADDKGQDIEVADKARCVEHAFTCFLGIAHGEEAHQDMWQAGSAEHQGQAEGECRDRIFHQPARAHDCFTFRVNLHRFGKQGVEVKVDMFHDHHSHERGARQQHDRLDDLHPGRCQHAAEQHIHAHQDTHQDHRNVVVQAKQQLDQLAGTDHLRDQVERYHHQRTTRRQRTNLGLTQSVRGHVGKGVFAQVAQTLGNQEQNDRPTHQKAD